jgi:hypothetical protein
MDRLTFESLPYSKMASPCSHMFRPLIMQYSLHMRFTSSHEEVAGLLCGRSQKRM